MALSEEHLRSAVDEVLEPAWPRERRRAARRLRLRTISRIAGGCVALWGLGFVVHLWVGGSFPWLFFGVIALLATVAASVQEDHAHLRRH
jgi:fatty acid desaturase